MGIQGWQWIIIAVIIILLFGAPKLPKLAKSVGQSMRIFKSEVKTLHDGEEKDAEDAGSESSEGRVVEGTVVSEDPTAQAHSTDRQQTRDHS